MLLVWLLLFFPATLLFLPPLLLLEEADPSFIEAVFADAGAAAAEEEEDAGREGRLKSPGRVCAACCVFRWSGSCARRRRKCRWKLRSVRWVLKEASEGFVAYAAVH